MSQIVESLKRPVSKERPMQDVVRLTLHSEAEPRELFGRPVKWVDMPDLPPREIAAISQSPQRFILSRPLGC
jgi:hypothetical protein